MTGRRKAMVVAVGMLLVGASVLGAAGARRQRRRPPWSQYLEPGEGIVAERGDRGGARSSEPALRAARDGD